MISQNLCLNKEIIKVYQARELEFLKIIELKDKLITQKRVKTCPKCDTIMTSISNLLTKLNPKSMVLDLSKYLQSKSN